MNFMNVLLVTICDDPHVWLIWFVCQTAEQQGSHGKSMGNRCHFWAPGHKHSTADLLQEVWTTCTILRQFNNDRGNSTKIPDMYIWNVLKCIEIDRVVQVFGDVVQVCFDMYVSVRQCSCHDAMMLWSYHRDRRDLLGGLEEMSHCLSRRGGTKPRGRLFAQDVLPHFHEAMPWYILVLRCTDTHETGMVTAWLQR
jgi:hypothetical protein